MWEHFQFTGKVDGNERESIDWNGNPIEMPFERRARTAHTQGKSIYLWSVDEWERSGICAGKVIERILSKLFVLFNSQFRNNTLSSEYVCVLLMLFRSVREWMKTIDALAHGCSFCRHHHRHAWQIDLNCSCDVAQWRATWYRFQNTYITKSISRTVSISRCNRWCSQPFRCSATIIRCTRIVRYC